MREGVLKELERKCAPNIESLRIFIKNTARILGAWSILNIDLTSSSSARLLFFKLDQRIKWLQGAERLERQLNNINELPDDNHAKKWKGMERERQWRLFRFYRSSRNHAKINMYY